MITTSYVARARDGHMLACNGGRYDNGYRNYQTPILYRNDYAQNGQARG